MPTEEKVSKFIEATNQEINAQVSRIEKEIEEYVAQSLAKFKQDADYEAYNFVQKSAHELKQKLDAEISIEKREQRKVLFVRRMEIMNEISDEASKAINQFTKTEEYINFLKISLKKAKDVLKDDIGAINCRADDVSKLHEIVKVENLTVLVVEDATIKLGGINVINKAATISLDDTLDTRAVAMFEQFTHQPELIITA